MVDTELRDLLQQRLCVLGVLEDPRLDLLKQLGAAALDHVAQQRPGGAAEANQRYPAPQLLPRQRDGLVDVVQLLGDVDVALQDLLVLLVVGRPERGREVRALLVHHLDDHAHGLRYHEDVGEDDGRVEEAGEALDRLQGQGGGDLRVAAALEEVTVALGLVVLGEVSAGFVTLRDYQLPRSLVFGWVSQGPRVLGVGIVGLCTLAHHPHGRPLNLLACGQTSVSCSGKVSPWKYDLPHAARRIRSFCNGSNSPISAVVV